MNKSSHLEGQSLIDELMDYLPSGMGDEKARELIIDLVSAVLEAMEEQHKGAIINGRHIETPAGRLWRAMLAEFRSTALSAHRKE